MFASTITHHLRVDGPAAITRSEREASDPVSLLLQGGPITAKKSLFLLDLVVRDGIVRYNVDLANFERIVINLFDKTFSVVEGLPQCRCADGKLLGAVLNWR